MDQEQIRRTICSHPALFGEQGDARERAVQRILARTTKKLRSEWDARESPAPVCATSAAAVSPPIDARRAPSRRCVQVHPPQSWKLLMDNEPTNDMYRALIDFRRRHGRYWKRALLLKWMNGADEREYFSNSLRAVRNQFGPSWLYDLKPAILDAAARRLALFDRLPEMCASTLVGTGEAIVIRRGETGYWPLPDGMTIDHIEATFRATPAQIAAMEAGSMFGWDMPGADPDRYTDKGLLRPAATRPGAPSKKSDN